MTENIWNARKEGTKRKETKRNVMKATRSPAREEGMGAASGIYGRYVIANKKIPHFAAIYTNGQQEAFPLQKESHGLAGRWRLGRPVEPRLLVRLITSVLQLSPVSQMCNICSGASYILYQFNMLTFFYQHRQFPLFIDRPSDSRSDGPYEPTHPLRDIKYWASTIYINGQAQYI